MMGGQIHFAEIHRERDAARLRKVAPHFGLRQIEFGRS
jgi:hypothetical protein